MKNYTYTENTKEITDHYMFKGQKYVTFKDGEKSVLWLIDGVWCQRAAKVVERISNSIVIIKGVSELLNMKPSGSDEDFCSSFYKKENGLKYRVSNHQTTTKWGAIMGYADVNIIIFDGKPKADVQSELKEVNLTIDQCLKAGNEAFEIIEHKRRMKMTF